MARITAARRRRLRSSTFALPKQRKYPIDTRNRARNALARVAQHGTPTQKTAVRRAVKRRYPSIAVTGARKRARTPRGR